MKSKQRQPPDRPRITRPNPRLKELLPDLAYLDQLRDELHNETGYFIARLNDDQDLLRPYLRFLDSGGVTCEDLKRYLQGRPIKRGRVITRKHGRLRLVVSKPPIPFKLIKGSGGEAA
jgi:hypothetical protein